MKEGRRRGSTGKGQREGPCGVGLLFSAAVLPATRTAPSLLSCAAHPQPLAPPRPRRPCPPPPRSSCLWRWSQRKGCGTHPRAPGRGCRAPRAAPPPCRSCCPPGSKERGVERGGFICALERVHGGRRGMAQCACCSMRTSRHTHTPCSHCRSHAARCCASSCGCC